MELNEAMKTTLGCLLIALILRLGFDRLSAQEAKLGDSHVLAIPGKVAVEWHFYDEHRVWLSINTFASASWPKEGYNPSFTYLRCQYKPIVKKMENGEWQVSFTSEIAENIP